MSNNIFSMSALSRYSELFQIVGVIGLIASLIFVGLELRQTQKIATANTQQERNYSMVNMFNTFTLNNIDWQSVAFENIKQTINLQKTRSLEETYIIILGLFMRMIIFNIPKVWLAMKFGTQKRRLLRFGITHVI